MSTIAESEWRSLCLGKHLGRGQNRDVYEFKWNPVYAVIKIERGGDFFQNIMEYRVWKEVKGTEWEKWFAPCLEISANGHYLIQARVEFPEKKKYPKKLPKFFTDTKFKNYGLYQGRWVACDYGFPSFMNGRRLGAMKKANWWQETGR